MLIFAIAGLISGVASMFGVGSLPSPPVSITTPLPGFFFGLALSLVLARKQPFKKLLGFTALSTLAFITAYAVGFFGELFTSGLHSQLSAGLVFFLAGLVGARILAIGTETFLNFRHGDLSIFVLLGGLLGISAAIYFPSLFPLWQTGMALAIGYYYKKSSVSTLETSPSIPVPSRRKYSLPLVMVVILIAIIGGVALYQYYSVSNNYNLTDSDVADLISYLKTYHLQAAVIGKVYQPNGQSKWLVKTDGEKILLDDQNLGDNGWGQPNYLTAINMPSMGAHILVDQAEIAEFNYYTGGSAGAKTIDISKHVTGHSVDSFWHAHQDFTEGPFWRWERDGGQLSPDSNYMINFTNGMTQLNTSTYWGTQFFQLNKVIKGTSSLSYKPISIIPGTEYLWSPDSKYILLQNDGRPAGVYDVANATTTYLFANMGYVRVENAGNAVTGTFARDANGNLTIKKGNGSVIPWMQLEAPSTSAAAFLDTNIPTPKGIGVIGFIQ